MHIKQLTIRRSTFYTRDYLSQPPMLSFKELDKVYSVICNLCYRNAAMQHRELALVGANTPLTPWLKSGGCGCGVLKCINAKRMPVDFFLAEFVARRPVAVLIHDVLTKRGIEIESYATTQRRRAMDTTPVVTCVSYLKRMINRDPKGEALGMALDLIHDTWEYSGNSLTANFLDAMHRILVVHADELDRKPFISKLQGHTPEELREQALVLRMGSKPPITIVKALQQIIIHLYNSGRPQHRRIDLGSPQRS